MQPVARELESRCNARGEGRVIVNDDEPIQDLMLALPQLHGEAAIGRGEWTWLLPWLALEGGRLMGGRLMGGALTVSPTPGLISQVCLRGQGGRLSQAVRCA